MFNKLLKTNKQKNQKHKLLAYTYRCSFFLAFKHIKKMKTATSMLMVNDENFSNISTKP